MKSFPIFIPANRQPFSKDIYLFLFSLLSVFVYCIVCFFSLNNVLKTIFFIAASLLCGVTFFIFYKNQFQLHFLKGTFSGYIVFSIDNIQLQQYTISINQIKSIRIKAEDFHYRYQNRFFGPKLSIGTQNKIVIVLNDHSVLSFFFQQKTDNELVKIAHTLYHYNQIGLLTTSNLLEIIGSYP